MDEISQLHMPVGVPGSGRIRYGAAMEFYRRGLITEAQLDVYRDASPHDSWDPAAILTARGLPLPPSQDTAPGSTLFALFVASRDVLVTLAHPGAAEVRAGLARCASRASPPLSKPHPVADRWLQPALAHVTAGSRHLTAALAAAAPYLRWTSYDAYPRSHIGTDFADGHAFASIAGEDAPLKIDDFELGVFLIAPHVLYRDHCHRAPELYLPLTGPHGWRFAPDRSLIIKGAGEPVWNRRLQPHLIKVGSVPFLSLFVWTRDVNEPARVLPAADWAALEETSLAAMSSHLG